MNFLICRNPKCTRQVTVIQADDKGFCDKHWEQYCDKQDRESEKKYLDPIETHIRRTKREKL